MNYDKEKLELVIKSIKNDLKIFCENSRLLKQNIEKYQQYKSFVNKHMKQKYDYSDMLKLYELDFYIAEIEINFALSDKDFKNAYAIFNSHFKNSPEKSDLKLKINSQIAQYINTAKIKLQGIYDINQRLSFLTKIHDQLPDEEYDKLQLYVDDLNTTYIKEKIIKLINSKNYDLAFKVTENIHNSQIQQLCINNILKGTKKYLQELFHNQGYPKCRNEIEQFLNEYPMQYKKQIIEYYDELKNYALIINKIKTQLNNLNFIEADTTYLKYNNIISTETYYTEKANSIKTYFKNNHHIGINTEQAIALSNISQNILITARAGSGKTRTIACKTILAIEKENIKPDEILLLTFNRNAAEEMQCRIVNDFGYSKFDKNCAMTFHSLAHDIIKPQEELIYDDGDREVQQKLTKFIDEIYSSKEILTNEFKNNLYEYYRWTSDRNDDDYIKYWVFKNDDEKYNYLRHKKKVTLNREKVKSNGEKWIADFLFEHDIKYQYEKLFTCDSFREEPYTKSASKMYHPDFTIWSKDSKISYIIEHWGIDEEDETKTVPKYWKKTWDAYHKEMIWKRDIIRKHGAEIIETSIADLENGRANFEQILKNKLESFGIVCNKLSKEEILEKIDANYINDMSKKFSNFIMYAQKAKYTPEDIDKKLTSNIFHGNKRSESFVKMANEIYKKYKNELLKQHKIDFDNLLINATDKIISTSGNCEISLTNKKQKIKDLKMILIDEYQDFSQLFFDMIKAILRFNPDIKLFCVGDDWQAINAFAGSHLKFFNDYSKYFKNSDFANLSCNYRSCKNIVESGNELMKDNGIPAKYIDKNNAKIELHDMDDVNIHKENTSEIDTEFIYDKKINDDKQFFAINHRYFKKCVEIISKNINQRYFIMHRETKLCHYYELDKFAEALKKYFLRKQITIDIVANTIHKFKGMEADNIIILECTNDELPLIHPDAEFYLIFDRTPQTLLDEEKKLFYVALTRAKKNIFILTERSNRCEYISKIKDYISNNKIDADDDENIDYYLKHLHLLD